MVHVLKKLINSYSAMKPLIRVCQLLNQNQELPSLICSSELLKLHVPFLNLTMQSDSITLPGQVPQLH